MIFLMSFISGVVFSIGLVISGMTNPVKVIGFLDLFGSWDYALAFVMGGAVLFNLLSFSAIRKRKTPICNSNFSWPVKSGVDRRLILGSMLFGIGWGLVGICPGPGIVNLVSGNPKAILFVLSMISGMIFFRLFNKVRG